VIFPTPAAGGLRSCAMTCVLEGPNNGGTWWRFEIATMGPFRVHVMKRGHADWSSYVVKDLTEAFSEPE